MNELDKLLKAASAKALASIDLLESSLRNYIDYDVDRQYTHDELVPYDALSDRFIRAVEIAIKYIKTWELVNFGINSGTLRDTLNKAEKNDLITDIEIWLLMRNIRNKIVHDYLPDEIEETYNLIVYKYSKEIIQLKKKIEVES